MPAAEASIMLIHRAIWLLSAVLTEVTSLVGVLGRVGWEGWEGWVMVSLPLTSSML